MALKLDSKTLLANALGRLAKKIPFEDITVQNILDESGLSRATFYRHFSDKYELMAYYYKSYIVNLFEANRNRMQWKELQLQIVYFYYDNKEYFKNISKYREQNSFHEFIYSYGVFMLESIGKANSSLETLPPEVIFAMIHYNAANVYTILEFLKDNLPMELNPESFHEWRYRCMPEILKPFLL